MLKIFFDNIQFTGEENGVSLAVIEYQHLSEDGKLGFLLYENSLVAVGFYPIDTVSYLNKFENIFGEITLDSSINKDGVLIEKGYDYEMGSIGGIFISWKDTVLISRYKDRIW